MSEICPGCKGEFQDKRIEFKNYIHASSGCFYVYSQILQREYTDMNLFNNVHRYTVDAYAVQHPMPGNPKAQQSVFVHLMALYLTIEKEMPSKMVSAIMQHVTHKKKNNFTVLEPPDFSNSINVATVFSHIEAGESHEKWVRKWAEEVYDLWSHALHQIKGVADTYA